MTHTQTPLSGDLDGRIALVTGGARGIGLECARAIARRGATVVLLDVLDAEPAARELVAAGSRAIARRLDVTDRAAVDACFDAIAADLDSVDVLVGAAGVWGNVSDIDALDEAEVEHVMGINATGQLWCTRAAMRHMTAAGWGRIILISSLAGVVGALRAGPHYSMSKGAVNSLVKWAAKNGAAHGVLANAIAPGATQTEMIVGHGYSGDYCPLGRLADAEEIGSVAGFLASSDARYMTGQVLNVSGGAVM